MRACILSLSSLFWVLGLMADIEPNNTQATAEPYTLGSTMTGSLSGSPPYDAEDWYVFTLPEDGTITWSWTSSATLNSFSIWGVNNQVWFGGNGGFPSSSGTITCLAAGTYWVELSTSTQSPNYTFTITSTPEGPSSETEPNNDTSSANSLTNTITGHIGFIDNTSTADVYDYYKITTAEDGDFKFTVEVDISMSMYLWYEDGMQVGQILTSTSGPTVSTFTCLRKGTYFVRVWKNPVFNSCGTYTINFELLNTIQSTETEPNNNCQQTNLVILSGIGALGHTKPLDEEDWYAINMLEPGDVAFQLNVVQSLVASVTLYRSDTICNQPIRFLGSTSDSLIDTLHCLPQGILLIRFLRQSGCGSYIFNWNQLPPTYGKDLNGNDHPSTAQTIEVGIDVNGQIGYEMYSGLDDQDIFELGLQDDGDHQMTIMADSRLADELLFTITTKRGKFLWSQLFTGQSPDTINISCIGQDTVLIYAELLSTVCGSYRFRYDLLEPALPNDPESNAFLPLDIMIPRTGHLGYSRPDSATLLYDASDVYTGIMSNPGMIIIKLELFDSLLAGVYLYNKDTVLVDSMGQSYAGSRTLVYLCADSGEYFVSVSSDADCGSYRVTFSPYYAVSDPEPNDFVNQALPLSEFAISSGSLGYPLSGATDELDYYQIAIDSFSDIGVLYSIDSSLVALLVLYTKDGIPWDLDTITATFGGHLEYECLQPDTFYLVFEQMSGCGNYGLSWSTVAVLGIEDTVAEALCHDSTDAFIDIAPFGFYTPITYAWSTGDTTEDLMYLGKGSYSVTVTGANGCATVKNYIVDGPDPLVGVTDSVPNNCYGDSTAQVNIQVSGGVPPYTYVWSNGENTPSIDDLPEGLYTVTVTDSNNCTLIKTLGVFDPSALSLTLNHQHISCYGLTDGFIHADVLGGTPGYMYSWSVGGGGASVGGLAMGTHSVTVTDDNGCTISGSAFIAEPDSLVASIELAGDTCNPDDVDSLIAVVSGGTQPYFYFWSDSTTGGFTDSVHTGTYQVEITDAGGCVATAFYEVNPCVGIQTSIHGPEIRIYPNPARDRLIVEAQDKGLDDLRIDFIDLSGKVLTQRYSRHGELDISDLVAGFYLVRIHLDGQTTIQRLVIAR